jgi:hypothetical protein
MIQSRFLWGIQRWFRIGCPTKGSVAICEKQDVWFSEITDSNKTMKLKAILKLWVVCLFYFTTREFNIAFIYFVVLLLLGLPENRMSSFWWIATQLFVVQSIRNHRWIHRKNPLQKQCFKIVFGIFWKLVSLLSIILIDLLTINS